MLGWTVPRGTLGVIRGNRRIDDFGIQLAGIVIIQTEPLHDAGAIVLDHDIGGSNELPRDRHTGRLLQIDDDTALIAIGYDVVRANALKAAIGIAQRIAIDVLLQRLDFYDVGTERAEILGRDRTGRKMGKCGNTDAAESSRHQTVSFSKRWIHGRH